MSGAGSNNPFFNRPRQWHLRHGQRRLRPQHRERPPVDDDILAGASNSRSRSRRRNSRRITPPVFDSSTSNDDGARKVLFPNANTAANKVRSRSDRLRTLEQRIKTVFEQRWPGYEYQFVRVLRAGAAGQTWLLRTSRSTARKNTVNVGFGLPIINELEDEDGEGGDGGGGDGEDEEGDWGDEEEDWGEEEDEEEADEFDDQPALFQNAPHIVNGFYFPKDPMKDILRTPGSSGWTGPRKGDDWLYLEYMEHGTLLQFVNACIASALYQIPNRMAWRFFLCLIRACIGMAYPPGLRLAGGSFETIPILPPFNGGMQPPQPPEQHIHGDMHSGNDYGAWEIEEEGGPQRNIFDAACLMVEIILMIPDGASKLFQAGAKPTVVIPLGGPSLLLQPGMRPNAEMVECYAECLTLNPYQSPHFRPGGMLADQDPNAYAHRLNALDPDLRNLLTHCLSADDARKPTLPHLLALATNALQRTPEQYRDWWQSPGSGRTSRGLDIDTSIYQMWGETDDGLRQVIQTCLLDATAAKDARDARRDAQQEAEGQTPETAESAIAAMLRREGRKSASTGRIVRLRQNTRQFYSVP
ncbi:hypothetical protein PG994_012662 [Apiospora phragmitis]|uniref:Protein kinase domain-containing protein n=1 Tax=Apiospora phragmitis TaxID=2905665 RepID=A0ABR1TB36_9PEZI